MVTLRIYLTVILVAITCTAFPQKVTGVSKKLSEVLQRQSGSYSPSRISVFKISVSDNGEFIKLRDSLSSKIISVYEPAHVLLIRIRWDELLSLLASPSVIFADELRKPKEEISIAGFDLSVNKVNTIHSQQSLLNGAGLVVSVKENKPDTTDIDFKGRFLTTHLASPTQTNHASIMSTIIGGGGNTFYDGKGVAWGSALSSSNFATLLPEPNTAYQQYGISVQNHSYGTGVENFYGSDAAAYDASVITNPSLVHVFSAGNAGTSIPNNGVYAGITGFANSTGSFKMAKNIICAGHTNAIYEVASLSSHGPAHDGRLLPQLVAYGEDGSSGAAALVSGVCLLLQQAFKEANANQLPSSALIRAVLFNSADDVASNGIDFSSGFGQVNAYKAVRTITNGRYFNGNVSNGGDQVFNLVVPAGLSKLKLTLAWNDPAAAANAPKALINDLDLELALPAASQTWQPWVLSSFPHIDSLRKLPVRKRDGLNNAEQVTIDSPAPGNYVIHVKGYNVTGTQNFSLAYQLDTADKFRWYHPAAGDNLVAGTVNATRWESTYALPAGQLEYTTDGSTWFRIASNVDLTKGYYQWQTPLVFSAARLRMATPSGTFASDTFTISHALTAQTGFNCADSFLLYWQKAPGVSQYQLYRLGDKYLQPMQTVADTFIVLSKTANPSFHYTVAPIVNGKPGMKSYTFDYSSQGVGCYIKTFFATLSGNRVILDLSIGTTYKIQRIVWEKWKDNGYIPLSPVNTIAGLQYTYTDNVLTPGGNRYRVKIELSNGAVIYSQPETVFYFDTSPYVFFPNPVQQYQPVTIISANIDMARLQVYNSYGALVYEMILDDAVKTIPAGKLSKGVYVCRIYKQGSPTSVQKLIVY